MHRLIAASLLLSAALASARPRDIDIVRIVIFPTLGNASKDQRLAAQRVVVAAAANMLPRDAFQLLAGEELDATLMQLGEEGSCADPACQARLLRLLSQGAGIQTEVMNVGGTLYMTARVLDGGTGTETHSSTAEGRDPQGIRAAVQQVLNAAFEVSPGDGERGRSTGAMRGGDHRKRGKVAVLVALHPLGSKAWKQGAEDGTALAAVTAGLIEAHGVPAAAAFTLANPGEFPTTGRVSNAQAREVSAGAAKLVVINLLEERGIKDRRITATWRIHDNTLGREVFRDDAVRTVACGPLGDPACNDDMVGVVIGPIVEGIMGQLKDARETPLEKAPE